MASQSSDIITDRPDQTESAAVVGKGVFQIETGVVFSKELLEYFGPDGDIKFHDYATTLLRYGVSRKVELRLATAYSEVMYPDAALADVSGLQPFSIGVKIALLHERGFWPETAVLGHLTLPWIGNDAYTPENIAPDFRLSFSHTLGDRFSLGYNLGVEWEGMRGWKTYLYSIALGAAIAGPASGFVEVYGEINEPFGDVDFGFTVLISPDIQFDTSYGLVLFDSDARRFLNAGISLRFR